LGRENILRFFLADFVDGAAPEMNSDPTSLKGSTTTLEIRRS
jgi:hypothetical protein